MHYTVLDQHHESLVPEGDWSYVGPEEMDAKVIRVVWPWLRKAALDLPEKRGLMVRVPEGENAHTFSNRIRTILAAVKPTRDWRWSVRTSKDDKALFVMKGELWPSAQTRLLAEAGMGSIEAAQST